MTLDYSNYEVNNKFYNGRERKIGIVVHGENYIIKFQRKNGIKKYFNHVSEYLGSHIFSILGVKAQEAFLGCYKGEEVVLIKDFNEEGSFFVPFNELSDLVLDSDSYEFEYSFEDVVELIKNNKKIDDVKKTVDTLWDIYIIDALIANADRHGNNWGFIKKDNVHTLAPIYANDSSLFSDLVDDETITNILKNQDEINKKVYNLPISPIKLDGKNSLYYEVISSLQYEECNQALKRIVERIDLEKIYNLIDSVELVSSTRKRFYKRIIKERYEKILLESYKKLVGDNHE